MALTSSSSVRSSWIYSFRYRDFRLLWGATLLQSLAMGMEHVASGWLVLEMTDSAFMVGVAAAARMAPFFFLGILSGAIADRVDRRTCLRVASLTAGIVALVTALVLLTDVAQVWHIILLACAAGAAFSFTMTIRQSYTYDIVGPQHALNGLSLGGMAQRAGAVVGAPFAGFIIHATGVGEQYLLIGAVHIASGLALFVLRDVGQSAPSQRDSVWRNLTGYIGLLRENRTLMILMMLTSITEVFGFTHQTLLPVFARDILGVGSVGLGYMTAIRQGGGVLGLILLANLGDTRHKGLLMFGAAIGFGLGQMAFSLNDNLFFFLAVLAFINGCASMSDTLYKTLMQASVPNDQRGRAMGSWVLSIGSAPIGHLGVGAMAASLGAPGALLVNGSVLLAASLSAGIGAPRIRRLG